MMVDIRKNGWGKWVISALLFFLLMGPAWPMPQELSPDEEQAIADAKSDTRKKVPLEWSLLNAALPLAGLFPNNQSEACFFSAAAGGLGLILALTIKPNFPVRRIIGKSPIYIETYRQVYKARMVIKTVQYAFVGCSVSGCVVYFLTGIKFLG